MMTNKIVTLADAKAHLSQLTDLAAAGETIIITKHGKPVAKVSQADVPRKPVDLEALRDLSATIPPQTDSTKDFMRQLRDNERY